jgi:LuxR family quorum-sensing system transcriptional regulator CciR
MLEKLKAILEARSLLDLRETTISAFGEMGMPRVFCLSPVGHDRSVGRSVTNAGFPMNWETAYRETRHMDDPLPDISVRIGAAFHWHRLPGDVVLNQEETQYLEDMASWGMAKGICVATYGSAARVGFFGASSESGEDDLDEVDLSVFQIVAEISYVRYCQLISAELQYEMNLSSRELDVLHWMAQGRSNAGIAEMLNLSQETVGTYVKRIFAKLDVFDRTSAVMKGVMRGLVIASDPNVEAAAQARRARRNRA